VGIATGAAGLVVIDVDVKTVDGLAAWRTIVEQYGPELEETAMARTPSGGRHLYYLAKDHDFACTAGKLAPGIDVRGRGGYVIAPPSLGANGNAYEWCDGHEADQLAELPTALATRLREAIDQGEGGRPAQADAAGEEIPAGRRNDALFRDACAMRRRAHTQPEILVALRETNKRCRPPLREEEVAAIVESALRYEVAGGARQPAYARTDAGNAQLFCTLFGDALRYDHRRALWYVWGGHRWRPDIDGEVYRHAVAAARQRYSQAATISDLSLRQAEARFAIASENRRGLDAMLYLAGRQLPIATSGEDWDRDLGILGVANGVLDLEHGRLREGRPEDMVSLASPVCFDPAARCPRWLRFLDEITDHDEELVDWFWRLVGYTLSGATSEQCFFLLYGLGSNGKSTFLRMLRALLGDYAANAPFSTFEANSRTSIPNDLAALVGRRLVTSLETSEKTPLNEARLKMLTGGDAVTARFLHREFFTFVPIAKFILAVNHKPCVRDYSHGFWRRLRLVPFEVRFDDKAAGERLEAELPAELPGILVWALAGYAEWRARGLEPPAAVRAATADYRADSDPLAVFLAECCQAVPEARLNAAAAWDAYQTWASDQGIIEAERLARNRFYSLLEDHFSKRHTNAGNVYLGVRLRSTAELEFDQAPKG